MKVICDRAALLDAVNQVTSVVPQRSPSPALSCLKLAASRQGNYGQLVVSGSDAETSLQLTIMQVDVGEPGVMVVSAHKLAQILSSVDQSDPTVTIELDGDTCRIKGARSRFQIFTFPAADFPPMPDFAATVAGSAPQPARVVFAHQAGALRRLIDRTEFASARETSRYAINGVLFKRDGKRLEMVATDGRRLALCRAGVKGGDKDESPTQCIVPKKALGLFGKLVKDPNHAIQIAITDNRIFFAALDVAAEDFKGGKNAPAPRAVLTSQLVEGSFPPYEDVIPKDGDKKITISTEELSRAVRQASVLTNEESRGVRMAFGSKTKTLKLSSRAPETGESEIECSLADYIGDDIEISFNPQFIAEALKTLDEPEVLLELKQPNRPGVFKVGTDFLYVVMPVNLPA